MSNLLLCVMGAFARFEREPIRERQRDGIAIAKRAGKYRGRKPVLTAARGAKLRERAAAAIHARNGLRCRNNRSLNRRTPYDISKWSPGPCDDICVLPSLPKCQKGVLRQKPAKLDRFHNGCIRSRNTRRGFSVKKSRFSHLLRKDTVFVRTV
jgi:resolvase-like protein